jgi:hypothetical protein
MGPLSNDQQATIRLDKRFKNLRITEIGSPENLDRRYFNKIPRVALQFMKGLLKNSARERLTALEALRHPYFDSIRDR